MNKKNRLSLWEIIKTYGIIGYIIFGIILKLAVKPFTILLASLIELSEKNPLYGIYAYSIKFGFIAIWIYAVFTGIRNKRYHILTGRSYTKDHFEFNKSYHTLVEFFKTNDPYKMDIDTLPILDWHHADGCILCKVKDRAGRYHLLRKKSGEPGNLISFGLPGSGKTMTQAATTAIRFNAKVRKGGCGVFAISIKGDLLNFIKSKRTNIKLFTPDKAEGSCHYNPLDGLEKMSTTDQKTFIENLSIIIVPDEEGPQAKFWVDGARDYFCGITNYLLWLYTTGKIEGKLTFPILVRKILDGNAETVRDTIIESDCNAAQDYTNSFYNNSEKNLGGIYQHLCKCVRPFITGALNTLFDGEGDCISPDDLRTSDIVIDVPLDKYDVYSPAMSIIISNFLTAFMQKSDVSSGKKAVPTLMLLDEAAQLRIPNLTKAMSVLRSKRTYVYLLMQSIAQLEGSYGENTARQIIDLCSYISVFNATDVKSKEYFSKLFGTRKMYKRSTSLSTQSSKTDQTSGISVSIEDEPIFRPADFGNLNKIDKKTGKTVYHVLVYANGKYVFGESVPVDMPSKKSDQIKKGA